MTSCIAGRGLEMPGKYEQLDITSSHNRKKGTCPKMHNHTGNVSPPTFLQARTHFTAWKKCHGERFAALKMNQGVHVL